MTKIVRFDTIGEVLDELQEQYDKGNVQGLVIAFVDKDGHTMTTAQGNISFIEKLGLVEVAKQDILFTDMSDDE